MGSGCVQTATIACYRTSVVGTEAPDMAVAPRSSCYSYYIAYYTHVATIGRTRVEQVQLYGCTGTEYYHTPAFVRCRNQCVTLYDIRAQFLARALYGPCTTRSSEHAHWTGNTEYIAAG